MSVKVLQGLIGQQAKEIVKPNNIQNPNSLVSQAATLSSAATSKVISGEAVSVSVRNLKSSGGGDRIREPKEATEVAEKVAEDIKTSDQAFGAHGSLNASAGAAHLA